MDDKLNKLIDLMEGEDIDYHSYDNEVFIDYTDSHGTEKQVGILLEGNTFECSTASERDDYEPKNERTVKSPKAVINYIERHALKEMR